MGIDKINNVNNYNDYSKINGVSKSKKIDNIDSVNISDEANNLVEMNKIKNLVNEAPDIRADRVNEVKEKLKDPNYIDNLVLNKVAEKIINPLS